MKARRHEFSTTLEIIVGESINEMKLIVGGTYHPAEAAFTYAGEIAPTDPPEPALYEIDSVMLPLGDKSVDIYAALSAEQLAHLEAEGRRSAEGE